jgi:hypothetical protein
MKTKMRWMAGAVLLVIAAAACERSLVQPDANASFGRNGPTAPSVPTTGTFPEDTIDDDPGYFGSGHYEPVNPPQDTTIR